MPSLHLLTVQQLGDDGRDDRPCRLPRSVTIEGPDDLDRQAERLVIAQGQLVGGNFRRRVRRLPDQGMLLVHRHVLCRPVGFARGSDDDIFEVPLPCRLQDIVGALDIGPDVGKRVTRTSRDADQRRQMKDGLAACHGAVNAVVITNITCDNLDIIDAARVLEPAPAVLRIVMDKRLDLEIFLRTGFNQVRADKTCCARNQTLHRKILFLFRNTTEETTLSGSRQSAATMLTDFMARVKPAESVAMSA